MTPSLPLCVNLIFTARHYASAVYAVVLCLSVRRRGQSHVTLLKFCPSHIFVIGEARHFEFRVLIDTEEYECMHDILLPKGMCSESRDFFKLW